MKKAWAKRSDDDLGPQYDGSRLKEGVRGKYLPAAKVSPLPKGARGDLVGGGGLEENAGGGQRKDRPEHGVGFLS